MRKFLSVTVLAVAIAALLPACNKSGDAAGPEPAGGSATQAGGAKQSDEAWSEKVNGYIEVGNRLRRFSDGGNEAQQRWAAQSRAKVAAGDFKEIRDDTHYFGDSTLNKLKEALDMPAATPAADEAARALLAALDKYLPNWKALESYNKAKKYEDDGGQEGKRRLPEYVEGIAAISAALDKYSMEVDKLSDEMHARSLAKYKAEGRLLEMHTLVALGSAEKIIDSFDEAGDFKNQAKVEEANKQLAEMDAAIVNIRSEHAKRKEADEGKDLSGRSLPTIDRYESVAEELERLGGYYREARKNPSKFNEAVKKYNDAVEEYNRMN
ncbi:DUF3829 domain-containing protein [Solilutibacter pythonis]|nr:DUF3829 domain-containing protein [Lysobacter pythonis]